MRYHSGLLIGMIGLLTFYAEPVYSAVLLQEAFNSASVPSGWQSINNSSPAGAGWMGGGTTQMRSRTNDVNFIAANFDAIDFNAVTTTAEASLWLVSPSIAMRTGDVLSFYTRGMFDTGSPFPDRLQIRLNALGTANVGSSVNSVGDFTTLLLDINPTYQVFPAAGAYPTVWTQYQLTVPSGIDTTAGRFAFRYVLTDGTSQGYEVGVDDVTFTSVPEPSATAMFAIPVLCGLLTRRRAAGTPARVFRRSKGRRAITMVEIVIVMSIIASVMGLVLPGVLMARDQSRLIACTMNAKVLARSLQTYASAFGGQYPHNLSGPGPKQYWHQLILDPVGTPQGSRPFQPGGGNFACPDDRNGMRSYAMNIWASSAIDAYRMRTDGQNLWNLHNVRDPARAMLVIESHSYAGSENDGYYALPAIGYTGETAGIKFGGGGGIAPPLQAGRVGWINSQVSYERHGGRATIAYADGHAANRRQTDLTDMQTGQSTGNSIWYYGEKP